MNYTICKRGCANSGGLEIADSGIGGNPPSVQIDVSFAFWALRPNWIYTILCWGEGEGRVRPTTVLGLDDLEIIVAMSCWSGQRRPQNIIRCAKSYSQEGYPLGAKKRGF